MKLLLMKKSDYSNIKSIEQLRTVRINNKCRILCAETKLKEDLLLLKESLRPESIFKEILSETLTFASHFCLYRRVFQLLCSLLRKI